MEIKVLLCNCKGLCPSFKGSDMNTLPFEVESELDVSYTILHPQLCGQGGNAVLMDVMSKANANTFILSGACAPEAQDKLFKKLMRLTGFPPERFIALDIRGTDNVGIMERLRTKVEELVRAEEAKQSAASPGLHAAVGD